MTQAEEGLLPRLIARRTRGPLFLTDRKAPAGTPTLDVRPETGRARGTVALLVGGVRVANTMVISVLERRAEIGLRRSLGATRGQIRTQFLCESLLLSALGGAGGVLLGIGVTGGHATYQGWPTVVPAWAMFGAVGATLVIGAWPASTQPYGQPACPPPTRSPPPEDRCPCRRPPRQGAPLTATDKDLDDHCPCCSKVLFACLSSVGQLAS